MYKIYVIIINILAYRNLFSMEIRYRILIDIGYYWQCLYYNNVVLVSSKIFGINTFLNRNSTCLKKFLNFNLFILYSNINFNVICSH